ncbi:MAG: flagellar basal-body MS-ring/collar protein FliF [Pseudomonadota bacterium]
MVNTLTGIWMGLDARRRGFLIGGVAALVVIAVILARLATAPSYALLYAGLDPAAAGEIVAAVEARGVAYRVQGDAIHVDTRERDSLRMSLAGDGLPANGAAGYELLDSLSGFGTTSQMFDAAYWRAKEGELARTITSSSRVRGARVHIANPGSDPFQPTQEVTASVAIRPAAGGLAPGHAQALRYLVASSVPGLLPEHVTVIDADSGQVLGGGEMMSPAADAHGRSEDLRRNIERLLAARVGPGNAVVQVSVELTTAHETILERRIDPESRVIISTETEERDDTSSDMERAGVSVASNLPEGDAAGGPGQSTSQTTEARERVTYDMSAVQREVEQTPGDIRRISVAVLLNGTPEIGDDGVRRIIPRPEAEIEALSQLVQSAIGYDVSRGDAVTINSMAFDESVVADLTEPGFMDGMTLDLGRVIQTVVLTAAALFIAFGLLRPLLTSGRQPALSDLPQTDLPAPATSGALAAPAPGAAPAPHLATVSSMEAGAQGGGTEGDTATDAGFPELPAMQLAELPEPDAASFDLDPVERLQRMIEEREEETVEILRSWMENDDEVPT